MEIYYLILCCAVIPCAVDYLEDYGLVYRYHVRVGVGIDRVSGDFVLGVGIAVPSALLEEFVGHIADCGYLRSAELQYVAFETCESYRDIALFAVIPRTVYNSERYVLNESVLAFVGVGVSRVPGDLGFGAGNSVPAAGLVCISGLAAGCGYLVCAELQDIALEAFERNGDDIISAFVPFTVDYLELNFLADRQSFIVGVGVGRVADNLGFGIGSGVPAAGFVELIRLIAGCGYLVCAELQSFVFVAEQVCFSYGCSAVIPLAVDYYERYFCCASLL